jgi:hypothetical protein
MISPLDHPRLQSEGYIETSECCFKYNCIAHAAGDKENWWWPFGQDLLGREAYWPKKAPPKRTIRAFVLAFKSLGYLPCRNGDLEDGYERVAIYVLNNLPTHMASQLIDGNWSHKMGSDIDLSASLTAVEGPVYGTARRYLKRKLTKRQKP